MFTIYIDIGMLTSKDDFEGITILGCFYNKHIVFFAYYKAHLNLLYQEKKHVIFKFGN